MKKLMLASLALAFAAVLPAHAQFGPAPSWNLTQGIPDSCDREGGASMLGVHVNIPVGQASESGVLSSPGNPSLGFTNDDAYGPNVGVLGGFFIFGTWTVPANTPLTLRVTTFNGTNQSGGVAFVSTITWNCTTGALVAPATAVPTLADAALALLAMMMLALGARAVRARARR